MQIALEVVFIAIALFVIIGACCYREPKIEVLGIFASDGTRLDRPMRTATSRARPTGSLSISASGDAHVSISGDGAIVVRGPGRVIIR